MTEPICFSCAHFKKYHPLTFLKPGECGWQASVPAWLEPYINSDDYYAPTREIWSRGNIIKECATFEQRPLTAGNRPDRSHAE